MSDENQKEIDEHSGVETTGHSWDGIKELNNPMPRWWLWTLYVTIVFGIGYTILYPAWPGITGSSKGILGWTSRGQLTNEINDAKQKQAVYLEKIDALELEQIQANADLRQFAIAGGSAAYKVNCSQCHGAGAAGSPGYPNLKDDDWIWGGSIDTIYTTLNHGIRHTADEDTRYSEMPAFGKDEILESEQILNVAEHVRALAGLQHDAEKAKLGVQDYADNCAACHGDNGEGNIDLGAPDLADAIWHYGKKHDEIIAQIKSPKHGVMPAWGGRLSDVTIKQLTVYVHSLGGGE